MATQLLPKWVSGDEGLELPDEVAVPAEPELELDPLADHGEPEILEARDLRPSEVLERKFLQRRPSPEPERFTEQLDRALRVLAANAPRRRASRSGRDRAALVRAGADIPARA